MMFQAIRLKWRQPFYPYHNVCLISQNQSKRISISKTDVSVFLFRIEIRMANSKLYELRIDSGRLSDMDKAMGILSRTMPLLNTRFPPLGWFTTDIGNHNQHIHIYQYGQWLTTLLILTFIRSLIELSSYEGLHTVSPRPALFERGVFLFGKVIHWISHPPYSSHPCLQPMACKWILIGRCCFSYTSHPSLSLVKHFPNSSHGLWTHSISRAQIEAAHLLVVDFWYCILFKLYHCGIMQYFCQTRCYTQL